MCIYVLSVGGEELHGEGKSLGYDCVCSVYQVSHAKGTTLALLVTLACTCCLNDSFYGRKSMSCKSSACTYE